MGKNILVRKSLLISAGAFTTQVKDAIIITIIIIIINITIILNARFT